MCKLRIEVTCKLRMRTSNFVAGTSRAIVIIVSCPAGNNLREIRLVGNIVRLSWAFAHVSRV